MEAAVSNFGIDKEIACLVNGKFGERLFKIAGRYGKATEIGSPWGSPLDLAALEHEAGLPRIEDLVVAVGLPVGGDHVVAGALRCHDGGEATGRPGPGTRPLR